jgi:hypothetical protein
MDAQDHFQERFHQSCQNPTVSVTMESPPLRILSHERPPVGIACRRGPGPWTPPQVSKQIRKNDG